MGKYTDLVEQVIKEYETYTDEYGVTRDDEGNVVRTGMSQGTRGGSRAWGNRGKRTISDLDKAKIFARKNGVSDEDVERYWKQAKGNIKAVYGRIKNKAKRG